MHHSKGWFELQVCWPFGADNLLLIELWYHQDLVSFRNINIYK